MTPEEIEEQRASGWPDVHPEDICHLCGQPNAVWWVDSDRWNLATANLSRKLLEILCPVCFIVLWEKETGLTAAWHLVPTNIKAV